MLPQKRIEPHQTEEGHGFEVRVIGAGTPSSAPATNQGVEIGLHIGAGKPRQSAPLIPEEGPIHRLESPVEALPSKLKATSDVGPAQPRPSRRRSKRSRSKQWTLGMAALSCLIVVVAVVAKLRGHSAPQPAATLEHPPADTVSDPVSREKKYLFDHFGSLSIEAEQLLERYAASRDAREALPMIRNSARLADRFAAGWQPWGESGASCYQAGSLLPAVDEVSPQPALVLRGLKADGKSFQYYFVRESGELRIDWEASEGRGDRTIAELKSGAAATDAIVRAQISPDTFFTPAFPESAFRSYLLSNLSGDNAVWAFVPIDSESARFLKRNLNEGSLLLSTGTATSATLKVTRQPATDANLFLVTKIFHNGWVSP